MVTTHVLEDVSLLDQLQFACFCSGSLIRTSRSRGLDISKVTEEDTKPMCLRLRCRLSEASRFGVKPECVQVNL